MTRFKLAAPIGGILSVAAIMACSDATGARRVPLSVSFTSKAPSARTSVAMSPQSRADIVVGAAGDLVLKKAQIVFDGIELSHNDGPDCNGTGELECEDVDQKPQLVDIPLTAGVVTQFSVEVPAGTYSRLDAEIGLQESQDASVTAFVSAHSEFKDKSIRVEGTYKGQPFVFLTSVHAKLELKFNPPLVVATGAKNVTVDVDVGSWFKTSAGLALDPTLSSNQATIAANIRNSFRALEDDNRDGDNDH